MIFLMFFYDANGPRQSSGSVTPINARDRMSASVSPGRLDGVTSTLRRCSMVILYYIGCRGADASVLEIEELSASR